MHPPYKGRTLGLLGEEVVCSLCGETENPFYRVSAVKESPVYL